MCFFVPRDNLVPIDFGYIVNATIFYSNSTSFIDDLTLQLLRSKFSTMDRSTVWPYTDDTIMEASEPKLIMAPVRLVLLLHPHFPVEGDRDSKKWVVHLLTYFQWLCTVPRCMTLGFSPWGNLEHPQHISHSVWFQYLISCQKL